MNGAASSLQLDESFCGVFSGSFGVLEVGFLFWDGGGEGGGEAFQCGLCVRERRKKRGKVSWWRHLIFI